MENWIDVPGYECLYKVSNMGNVKAVAKIDINGKKRKERILLGFNRLCNLQLISNRDNILKSVKRSSKYPGVYKLKNGRFNSKIRINGKSINIGCFSSQEEAYEAYMKFRKSKQN